MKIKSSKQNIEELVYAMLLENTGTGFGDSGGTPIYNEDGSYSHSVNGYGRAYERNKTKTIEDFKNTPSISYNLEKWGLSCRMSIFHHLVDSLSLDSVCDSFNDNPYKFYFDDFRNKHSDSGYSDELQKWIDDTIENFNDGQPIFLSSQYNTYNGDSDVSQDYQYFTVMFDEEDYYDCYIAIAIHQGCDAHGGYTYYKLFKKSEGYLEVEKQNDQIEWELENGGGTWSLDDTELTEEQVKMLWSIYVKVSEENTNSGIRKLWEIVYKMAKYVFDEYLTEGEIAEYEEWKVKYEAELMNSNPNQLKLL